MKTFQTNRFTFKINSKFVILVLLLVQFVFSSNVYSMEEDKDIYDFGIGWGYAFGELGVKGGMKISEKVFVTGSIGFIFVEKGGYNVGVIVKPCCRSRGFNWTAAVRVGEVWRADDPGEDTGGIYRRPIFDGYHGSLSLGLEWEFIENAVIEISGSYLRFFIDEPMSDENEFKPSIGIKWTFGS